MLEKETLFFFFPAVHEVFHSVGSSGESSVTWKKVSTKKVQFILDSISAKVL